jgi:hypothetical protein
MTEKLPFLPEQNSYGVTFSQNAIMVKLAGGVARVRADQFGAASQVSASWLLEEPDWAQFQGFWHYTAKRGTVPFLADLIVDTPYPTQYKVQMIPGSYRVDQVKGRARRVSMTLEIEPVEFTVVTALFSSAGTQITVVAQPVGALDVQVIFAAGDKIQVQGAGVNNGVNTPMDLDGIYEVTIVPTPTVITLNNPASVNPAAWAALATYPSGLSGNIPNVCLVRVPT